MCLLVLWRRNQKRGGRIEVDPFERIDLLLHDRFERFFKKVLPVANSVSFVKICGTVFGSSK